MNRCHIATTEQLKFAGFGHFGQIQILRVLCHKQDRTKANDEGQ